jgi:uncharacterized protein (TIGR00645 family)
MNIRENIESSLETIIFQSRWLLAPLYVGLIIALGLLVIKFGMKLFYVSLHMVEESYTDLILNILGLIDIVLVANLLLIIIFSGYESFVSKIDMVQKHVDRPDWMGTIDYGALKLKVIGSIVAISSIELLKVFIKVFNHPDKVSDLPYETVMWLILLHLSFVVSGLLFALMERLTPHHVPSNKHHKSEEASH